MPFVTDEVVTAAKLNMATVISGARADAGRTFTNTSFADLDALTGGAGSMSAVAVTVTTGTSALVIVGGFLRTSTAGSQTVLSYRVSGASTIVAGDTKAFLVESSIADAEYDASKVIFENGLTAGSNTFELQARVVAGTGTIQRVHLVVMGIV